MTEDESRGDNSARSLSQPILGQCKGGRTVVVRNPAGHVRRLLQITDLASRFHEPIETQTNVADTSRTDRAVTGDHRQRHGRQHSVTLC